MHSRPTTDHEEIRRRVEEHGGRRATVKSTELGDNEASLAGQLPGPPADGSLQDIDWDTFFSTFEEPKLAFAYQDEAADGQESRSGDPPLSLSHPGSWRWTRAVRLSRDPAELAEICTDAQLAGRTDLPLLARFAGFAATGNGRSVWA